MAANNSKGVYESQKSYEIDGSDSILGSGDNDLNQESTLLEGLDELAHVMGYGTIHIDENGEVEADTSAAAVSEGDNDGRPPMAPPSSGHHRRNHSGMSVNRHRRNESIAEAFVEDFKEVTDIFVDELEEADQTEHFFLDMGLTRGLSILPGDLMQVAEATAPIEQQQEQDTTIGSTGDPEKQPLKKMGSNLSQTIAAATPISAYFGLAAAVFALSSIGPLLQMQETVDPVMKIFWRMNATAILLLPFAVRSVWMEGGLPKLTKWQCFTFVLTAGSYATMCTAFVIALKFTAVGNAVILANSQALILLVAKVFVGDRVLLMEAAGALIAFSGAALCSKDSSEGGSDSMDGSGSRTILGDGIALIASVSGVWYLVLAKTIRPYVSLYLFMFLIMGVGSFLVWTYMALVGIEYSFDRDLHHGLWGWMNLQADRLPLEMTMVIFCNFCGSIGYIRAMHYFDTLVIAVAALLEPVVAELMASSVGVSSLPGALGWVGNFMVAAGTFAVVYPTAKKQ